MMRQAVFWAVALMGAVSCATFPFPRHDAVFWAPVGPKAAFELRDLTISTKPTTGSLRQTALDLAVVAARKAGLSLGEEASGPRFDLTLSLEEREFGVELDSYNSVSLVLKVWAPGEPPRIVGQLVYAEETKKTLRSSNYLFQVLEAVFAHLALRLKEFP